MNALVAFFSWIMAECHRIVPNYWADIVIFTAITKVILFPVSLWCHVNSLKMVSLMPQVNRLKVAYYGYNDKIGEETAALFKKEHYHPLLSLLPLALQIFVLMAFVKVIYRIAGGDASTFIARIPVRDGGAAWFMPLAAGAAALLLGLCQNRIHPLQHEQSRVQQMTTNGISVAISLFLGCYVATGVGLYWVASNLFSILVQLWCNATVRPSSRIDYRDLYASRAELEKFEYRFRKPVSSADRRREKDDYRRFFRIANKHVVFYAEGGGFYKYFKSLVEWLLAHSNLVVHYVTNDPADPVFRLAETQPRIRPYYIGSMRIISLMMKMDADMVVMTTPDLGKFQIKRSYVRKDVEYVYLSHGVSSVHLCLRQGAFDNYDTIFAVGPYQIDEHRKTEEVYHLKQKKLVPTGYLLLDSLLRQYEHDKGAIEAAKVGGKSKILVAPSYHEGNILESCLDELLAQLKGPDRRIVVRPHPRFISHQPAKMQSILDRYKSVPDGELCFEMDFSSNFSIYESDVVVSDWSSISYEFSFTTKKPCLIIDTPMKVINPEWRRIGVEPADIWMRDHVGALVGISELHTVGRIVSDMISQPAKYADKITQLMNSALFHPGHSAEIAGSYILESLLAKHHARKRESAVTSSTANKRDKQ